MAPTVSGGNASPITKTCSSVGQLPGAVCAAKTVSMDGTKSVTVTPWEAMVSATYAGSR
ncbi:hypothetical protein NG2371_07073 [Nocardia gamkensis]|nr:hypothetical protein [Nocardia gamkensis]